jgi:hypothetical protein
MIQLPEAASAKKYCVCIMLSRLKALKLLSLESLPFDMVKIHTLNKLKLLNYKLQSSIYRFRIVKVASAPIPPTLIRLSLFLV